MKLTPKFIDRRWKTSFSEIYKLETKSHSTGMEKDSIMSGYERQHLWYSPLSYNVHEYMCEDGKIILASSVEYSYPEFEEGWYQKRYYVGCHNCKFVRRRPQTQTQTSRTVIGADHTLPFGVARQ